MKQLIKKHIQALSLVEVLIALTIVSFVFLYVNQTMFASLKRVKTLELQDKMLDYANEGVEVVRRDKDSNWDSFLNKFPQTGNANTRYTYVLYTDGKPKLAQYNASVICAFDESAGVLQGAGCETTIPAGDTSQNGATSPFGRLIFLTYIDPSKNYAIVRVVIACVENKCTSEDFKPIQLQTYVYRTTAK